MSRTWQKVLSSEERSEVEAAVVEAYKDSSDGTTRSHADAADIFLTFIRDAEKAQRSWAKLLLVEWAESGAANFAKRMWARRDAFSASAVGQVRERRLNRGVLRIDGEGRQRWTSETLLAQTRDDIEAAIRDEVERVDQGKFNVAWLRQILKLLDRTGAKTVNDALDVEGWNSLDDFLVAEA